MKNIEKQLTDLQQQIEQLTGKISQLLANAPSNESNLSRTLNRRQNRLSLQESLNFKQQKGINRFRALQPKG